MLENIIIDQFTQNKIDGGSLNIADHLLLTLANFTAELFPNTTTYVGSQQQAVEAPALFVDFYSIDNRQKVIDLFEYEFGIEITYIPQDEHSTVELNNAIFTIQQSLHKLQSEIGEFVCYDKSSDITNGLAHVTGTIRALEIDLPTEAIIQIADKELNVND